jgi:hypothetical protein
MKGRIVVPVFVGFLALLCETASAQVGVAGLVRDGTGAAMPGVTVEASSPALIEKTRSVVSDAAGQYRLVDLSPGIYTVTFTLPGFKTVRRADIALEGTMIAQVNAEMEIGSIEESITVTGESPVVDVVSNRSSFVASRDILDTLPVATRNLPARVNLIPGASVTFFTLGQYNMSVHGSAPSDMTIAVDGMRLNNLCGSGQYSGFYLNDAAAQEITFLTGSGTAEVGSGGLRINVVPKDGGNTFAGTFFGYGAGGALQADNRSDEVEPFVPVPPGINYEFQVNPSFGGPILRDRLWFNVSYRGNFYERYATGAVFDNGDPIPITPMQGNYSLVTRLTWQATNRDKFRVYLDRQMNGEFYNNASSTRAPEATWDAQGGGWTPQVKWSQTTTNRMLLEAGYSRYDQPYDIRYKDSIGPLDLPRYETTTQRWSGANEYPWTSWTVNNGLTGSMSYVTGSHAFKAGTSFNWGTNSATYSPNGQIYSLNFLNGAPYYVVVRNTPFTAVNEMKGDLGIYGQDAWTLGRLTLNLGGRYDYFHAAVPDQHEGPGPWTPFDRNFPGVDNVPKWRDWAVRMAGAYDLFGNGKTALKVAANRYLESMAAGFASEFNPMTPKFEVRGWFDADRNNSILDANGNLQFNEVLGGSSNFGAYSATRRPDEDLRRGYNWEQSVAIEHELMPRIAVSVGYYRRQYRNLRVTDNLNLATTTDWNSFNVQGPSDSRFPTGGGEAITMYSLNANKVTSAVDEISTHSTTNETIYNGFEVNGNARFGKGFLFGGVTTQRTTRATCDVRDNPNNFRFCEPTAPFRTLLKASASYELPYAMQVSASYYGNPGSDVDANYTVTGAIAGRPISGGVGDTSNQIVVNLIEPNTLFLDYQHRVDTRVARNFRWGRSQIQGFIDLFNLFNDGTVTSVNETYNPTAATGNVWMRPLSIVTGRTLRFGAQMSF